MWRQHPYKGSFSNISISLPAAEGVHNIKLLTSKNAAGNKGYLELAVPVNRQIVPGVSGGTATAEGNTSTVMINISAPSGFGVQAGGTVQYFVGDRNVEPSDPILTLNGEDAFVWHYTGTIEGATLTVTISKASFTGITDGIDGFDAEVSYSMSDGSILPFGTLTFRGSGPITTRFSATTMVQGGSQVASVNLTERLSLVQLADGTWSGTISDDNGSDVPLTQIDTQGQGLLLVGADYRDISISIPSFSSLTSAIDQLSAELTIVAADGTASSNAVTFVETGNETLQFISNIVQAGFSEPTYTWSLGSVSIVAQTSVGTVRPFKIRVRGLDDISAYKVVFDDIDFDLATGADGDVYCKGGSDQVFVEIDETPNFPDIFRVVYFDTTRGIFQVKTFNKRDQKGRIVKRSDLETLVSKGVTLVTFNLQADINDDGRIDDTDDALEYVGKGELMRVNDGNSNGAADDTTNDDDLQELTTTFKNGGAKDGDVWFEIDNPAAFQWYKDRVGTAAQSVYHLKNGDKVPPKLYLSASATAITQESTFNLYMNFGTYDADPAKRKYILRDLMLITVVTKLGDADYFAAARDYIMENKTKFFTDVKTYGANRFESLL